MDIARRVGKFDIENLSLPQIKLTDRFFCESRQLNAGAGFILLKFLAFSVSLLDNQTRERN